MKFLKRLVAANLIVFGVTALGTTLVYMLVLDDRAKESVQTAVSTVRESYNKVNTVIEDMTGIVVEEDAVDLPNSTTTKSQWEKLGF